MLQLQKGYPFSSLLFYSADFPAEFFPFPTEFLRTIRRNSPRRLLGVPLESLSLRLLRGLRRLLVGRLVGGGLSEDALEILSGVVLR